ncbi:monocarboxylate transporter 14-like [Nematostella vectensis]|uniref:monocarboxylate transporter 14-like n=1 Tax=Nematostella vectensis TaxID=45351 RepID=UPI0020772417|nr:monocarboxylate transporter 14-like [Nematostella vectensis]
MISVNEFKADKITSEEETPQETANGAEPSAMRQQEDVPSHMDKGWAWVVCFSSFCITILAAGLLNCAGIIFVELLERYKQGRGKTAWVTSLASGFKHFLAIICTLLVQRYGSRATAIAGGFVCAIAFLSSAYSPSLELLYVTYGVGLGLGTSLCFCSGLGIIPMYFEKHQALAYSLGQLGAPVGTLTLTPLLQYLFNKLGFSLTMVAIAGFHIIVVISGLTYRPVPEVPRRDGEAEVRAKKGFDVSVFKNRKFVMWLVCLATVFPALLIPYVHLVRLAEDKGISEFQSAFLLYFISVTSAICRPIVGHVSDRWPNRRLQFLQFAFFFFSTANFLAPLATSFAALAVYACAFGVFEAFLWSLIVINTVDIVGVHRLPSGIGWLFFLISFPEVSGPPFAGWIYDLSKSYSIAFFVSGGVVALAGLMMFSLISFEEWFCCNTYESRRIDPIPNPPAV